MLRTLATCGLATLLVGCSSNNTSSSILQYSSKLPAFPHQYQIEAARIVQERDADPGFVRVSRPRAIAGDTVLASTQWYVCIRGIPSPAPQNEVLDALARIIRSWFASADAHGVYDVVLFFSGHDEPSAHEGFDLALCRDSEFEFITVDPPAK
jgi:hypothetical protein